MYFHIPPGIDPGLGLDARPGHGARSTSCPRSTPPSGRRRDVVENKERVRERSRSRAPGDAMRSTRQHDRFAARPGPHAQPDERAYTFLEAGEHAGSALTWAAVDRRSRALGGVDRGPRRSRGARADHDAARHRLRAGVLRRPLRRSHRRAAYPPAGVRTDRTSARAARHDRRRGREPRSLAAAACAHGRRCWSRDSGARRCAVARYRSTWTTTQPTSGATR